MIDSSLAGILADIKRNAGKYYVYILSYPSGVPFYVGCGKGSRRKPRILDHERFAFGSGHHSRSTKSSIIRKIVRSGGDLRRTIDSWHLTSEAMFEREVALIAELGRRDIGTGVLANGNGGGTGQLDPTEWARSRASAGLRAWWTDERRSQARTTARERLGTEASREKMRSACALPERRARLSLTTKAALKDPVKGKNIQDPRIAALRSPEYRKRRSELAKVQFQNPAARELASKKQKDNWSNPEYREAATRHLTEMARKRWTRDDAREKARLASSRPWSKEVREKCTARQKASWTPDRRASAAERMRIMRAAQEDVKRATRDEFTGHLQSR